MKPSFREQKTTQLAAKLLKLRGGTMSYLKLIKLMYLVDRRSLTTWGRPVTYDHYVSMPHGPVLSATLDRLTEEALPWVASYWRTFISEPSNWEVHLRQECPPEDLSDAEERLAEAIFDEFGHMDRWDLVRWVHANLPEWKDPGTTSTPISYEEILTAAGIDETDVAEIRDEIDGIALMDQLMSGVNIR